MKTSVLAILFAILLITATSTTQAFDGNRKGFVLGGGLGVSPVATWKSDAVIIDFGFGPETIQQDESNAGVGINLLLGYAWDEHNMIVYEGNYVGYSENQGRTDILQGFGGASWYHYFGPVGKSGFITAGVGWYSLDVDGEQEDDGGGLQIGGGYEFARHFQVGGYLSVGKTRNSWFGRDSDHSHFSVLVSGIAF